MLLLLFLLRVLCCALHGACSLACQANGFILNRLQYALLMEAWRCVEDGICSAEDCDTAVSQGLGLRWSFMVCAAQLAHRC